MTENIRLWVSEHAQMRFIERVLAPHGLLFDTRFWPKANLYRFLRKLSKRVLLALKEGKTENERHLVPWPNKDDGILWIVLVIDPKTGVLVTCWPRYAIRGSTGTIKGGG